MTDHSPATRASGGSSPPSRRGHPSGRGTPRGPPSTCRHATSSVIGRSSSPSGNGSIAGRSPSIRRSMSKNQRRLVPEVARQTGAGDVALVDPHAEDPWQAGRYAASSSRAAAMRSVSSALPIPAGGTPGRSHRRCGTRGGRRACPPNPTKRSRRPVRRARRRGHRGLDRTSPTDARAMRGTRRRSSVRACHRPPTPRSGGGRGREVGLARVCTQDEAGGCAASPGGHRPASDYPTRLSLPVRFA